MIILEKIDQAAKDWNQTKNPRYKKLWYKLIKEYGLNNTKRWNVSSSSSDQADDGWNSVDK